MKENNLLLEIGCEEIPARFMPEMIADLKKKTEEKFSSNRLSCKSIETFGTPRRLVLFVEGLSAKQPDLNDEIKGPPAEIAFDKDGNPTQAVIGFAKKNGLDPKQLSTKVENGRKFVCATILKKGQSTDKLLKSLLPELISSLYMPISMKWGEQEFKFIRPIHWILALYGTKIVGFELAGIKTSNTTLGHRFAGGRITHYPLHITLADKDKYFKLLLAKKVIVDQDQRRKAVEKAVKKAAPLALIEPDLLDEVTYLVESPEAVVCSFNKDFLALPKEVLITSMKKNQKYFPIMEPRRSAAGSELSNQFVVITNACKEKSIRYGNQKVISARLSDAKFFFDEDKQIPLKVRVNDLKRVQFFEGLGNMEQKANRVAKLSVFIAKQLNLDPKHFPNIEKTALLCKADLLTKMVFEFPELQGTMGREYALISGEEKTVAEGIYEHYLPRFAEDKLPKTVIGTVVSLADKIDTIVGCFGLGKIPTGSQDPYGLRRAALGIVRIITTNKIEMLMDEVIANALKNYVDIPITVQFENVYKQIMEFISGRFKVVLLEEGISHDVIEAAFYNISDLLYVSDIARVLQNLKDKNQLLGIVKTHDRIQRISAQSKRDQVLEHDLEDQYEKKLFDLYLKTNWEVEEKIKKGEFEAGVLELTKLTAPVEEFFEKVLVMHQDERIKSNRLALLKTINTLFLAVGDLRKIVV